MTQRINPPPARRLSAVAIAAALAAFAGIAGAQTSSGYATSSGGGVVYSGSGGCVRTQASAPGPCTPMNSMSRTSAAAAPTSSSSTQLAQADSSRSGSGAGAAAAGATAAGAGSSAAARSASAGGPPRAAPGYAQSSDGRVVLSGSGQCVRTGSWVPANAAEPCDRVPVANVPPPPVAAAVPAPAPEPMVQPAPVPVPLAQPEPPRPVIQKLTLSTDVLFDFGKAELKDSGKARLDQLASEIKDADVDEIVAVGHADRIASDDYNQKLSEARAQAVKDYLTEKGAKSNTITAQGKGESQPVTGEDCKKLGAERSANKKLVACLQPDRRVEIEVLGSRTVSAGSPAAGGTGTSSPAAGSGSTTGSTTNR